MINGRGRNRMTLGLRKHKIFSDLIPYKLSAELKLHWGGNVLVKEQRTFHREVLLTKDARAWFRGNGLIIGAVHCSRWEAERQKAEGGISGSHDAQWQIKRTTQS